MLSSLWKNINFWSDYGNYRDNITPEICSQIAKDENLSESNILDLIESELSRVNRIIVEAGADLSDNDWIDVAINTKRLFGEQSVLDISIKKNLLGGARISVLGNWVDFTVVNKYRRWRGYE